METTPRPPPPPSPPPLSLVYEETFLHVNLGCDKARKEEKGKKEEEGDRNKRKRGIEPFLEADC